MQLTAQNMQTMVIGIKEVKKLILLVTGKSLTIALDTETTGLSPFKDKVVCIQFGTEKSVFVLDCRPFYSLDDNSQLYWKTTLYQFFSRIGIFVMHNGKFDYKMVYQHFNVKLDSIRDCMLQELLLYGVGMGKAESEGIAVNMEDTADRYGIAVSKAMQIWSVNLDKPRRFYENGSYSFQMMYKGKLIDVWYHSDHTLYKKEEARPDKNTFIEESTKQWYEPFPDVFVQYCKQDVLVPLKINTIQQELLREKELEYVATLENRCIPAIAHMELNGVHIDRERWQAIVDKKKDTRILLENEIQTELNPYIQRARQREYQLVYDKYVENDRIKENYIRKLAETFERGKVTTKSNKSFLVVNGQSLSWAKYKAVGLKELKEVHPLQSVPKLDTSSINIGSSKQLIEALGEMGVALESTDREHLEPLIHKFPVIGKLLQWKDLDHFINAFGESILSRIEEDGRVHPEYNQLGAATGRMSCQQPNWQQIPAREPTETSVRRCVIAEKGNVLITMDLPNIELRIVADMSKDDNMLYAFERGEDLHSKTARIMFNLNENVDPKKVELVRGFTYRQVAKTINFGLVYGMSPVKLSRTLGIPKEKAVELFDRYFTVYEGVARWLDETAYKAKKNGYSATYAGRKRFYNFVEVGEYDKDTMEWDTYIAQKALAYKVNGSYERRAKNHPVQGTNADIIKHTLVLLHKYASSDMRVVACVHDEIVVEVPQNKAEERAKLLSMCLHKACKYYLKTVYIPEIESTIASYWSKD